MKRQFYRFVLPSMLTMLLTGLYTIVDGLFIGNAVGDAGLAAVGLVWPVAMVILSLGIGIGVGGSVLLSTYRGAGDQARADKARGNTILLLLVVSVLITAVIVPLCPLLVRWLGAEGAVYDAALTYLRVIAWGGGVQVLATGLTPILRNSNRAMSAMVIMVVGLVCNITLDALLTMVIPWGMFGAALATILGQAVTAICCVVCLLRVKEDKVRAVHFRPEAAMLARMARIGLSPFGLSVVPSVVAVLTNWQCLAYGGDGAVTAYSAANYFLSCALLLLQGVGEGMQPLVSYHVGAGDHDTVVALRRQGLRLSLGLAALFLAVTVPARTLLPVLFATSQEAGALISRALPMLALALPMTALAKLFISYFYAKGQTAASLLLVYADPLLFTPVFLFGLPVFLGLDGVWMALPAAQGATVLLLLALTAAHSVKEQKKEREVYVPRDEGAA